MEIMSRKKNTETINRPIRPKGNYIKENETGMFAAKEKPWKAFIMYPTLAIALIGAVPQYWTMIEATLKGISSNKVREQEHLTELWKNNLDCIKKDSIPISDNNTEIQVRFCSASLFLIEKLKANKSYYEWVEINDTNSSSLSLFAEEHHLPFDHHRQETLCISNHNDHMYHVAKDLRTNKCQLIDVDQTTGIAIHRDIECSTKCP